MQRKIFYLKLNIVYLLICLILVASFLIEYFAHANRLDKKT